MSEPRATLRFPERLRVRSPVLAISIRFAIAVGIVLVNWLIVLVERGGYTDTSDGTVSVADALYYTTVTLTTTGYGDITPVTTAARIINAIVVTPMRLVFVILLVGTTINALTRQSRHEFRHARWRKRVRNHTVVIGYGTKGRNAVRALVLKGAPPDQVVVIDSRSVAVTAATEAGHVAVQGNGTSDDTLARALIERATSVVIAVDRDDSAILATLSARRMNPTASITVAVRDSENVDLLKQSGATSVIVSSETVGRLLGLAPSSPASVEVVEDLLSFGDGLDIAQRPVRADEVGRASDSLGVPLLAVVRDGRTILYYEPAAATLQNGDAIIYAEHPGERETAS